MISLGIVYTLVSVALFVIAVVVHVNNSFLSLPISPVLSVLTIILPIVSLLNGLAHPHMLRLSQKTSSRLRKISPFVLQTLQALLTTILATLLFESAVPSTALDCVLETEWMQRFKAHDGGTIRQIQDSLNCCGFNSVKDRAFPFPKTAPSTCSATYGRDLPCKGPWKGAMQTNSGTNLAIVLITGLLQVVGLLVMREGTNWWAAWCTRGWKPTVVHRESSRPLLTASGDDESAQHDDLQHRRYGSLNENESRPRVEPSPISEPNEWDE